MLKQLNRHHRVTISVSTSLKGESRGCLLLLGRSESSRGDSGSGAIPVECCLNCLVTKVCAVSDEQRNHNLVLELRTEGRQVHLRLGH